MKKCILLAVLFSLAFGAQARIWTDTKGNMIEADLVNATNDKVTLSVENKKRCIQLNTLCEEDQTYVLAKLDQKSAAAVSEKAETVDLGASAKENMDEMLATKASKEAADEARLQSAKENFRIRMAAMKARKAARCKGST